MESQGISIPTEISALDGMAIRDIAAAGEKSAIINSYGELFAFGSAKNRSLVAADGSGYKDNLKLPTCFETDEILFTKVAVAKDHIAAITEDGRLFTMGSSEHGKLGHPHREVSQQELEAEQSRYKREGYRPGALDRSKPAAAFVEGAISGKQVISVACGDKHTVCVTSDGNVYSWGSGKAGALGFDQRGDVTEPTLIEGL